MASRKAKAADTDLYVKLHGRPGTGPPVTPSQTPSPAQPQNGESLAAKASSFWAEGDRDPTKKRDIPHFYPYFYHSVLARNGKPLTGQNIFSLIEYIHAMLHFQGNLWIMEDIQDPRTGEVFKQRFGGPLDEYPYPEHRPDDEVDFLWAFRATVRPGLRQFVDQTYTRLTSPDSRLLKYGRALPLDLWHDA
ncbi:hypothetical protein HY68_36120 [Streptomyces sp. AcH 505]|uniref:hypothetical protein n=1 Tax=Streptomyces sp. AcH 505 TaxID=352211 RepID=UPI000591FA1F|nr:hypothetical protein HY68_36120 [Streptomyces sp. AcH 505]